MMQIKNRLRSRRHVLPCSRHLHSPFGAVLAGWGA
jgi:hypothetical protein